MSEQPAGLRFDIYERVTLSDDVPGIRDLEEIELVPRIEVLPQGDQAILKGELLLSGVYAPEGSREAEGGERLTHYIPVEITLPMNRVTDLSEIAVEIENFDVELLSQRSLNVTGILSLHGVEMVTSAQQSWREEDLVFTHRAEEKENAGERASAVPPQEPQTLPAQQPQAANAQQLPVVAPFQAQTVTEPNVNPGFVSPFIPVAPPAETVVNASAETFFTESANVQPAAFQPLAAVVVDEKKEPKIAFSAAKEASAPNAVQPLGGLETLIGKQAATQQQAQQSSKGNQQRAQESSDEPVVKDALQWKKLFLRQEEESASFKRVKMCIVQKEETIDSIAERYNISSRQIALYNRLGDAAVQQGQIIYIPS